MEKEEYVVEDLKGTINFGKPETFNSSYIIEQSEVSKKENSESSEEVNLSGNSKGYTKV